MKMNMHSQSFKQRDGNILVACCIATVLLHAVANSSRSFAAEVHAKSNVVIGHPPEAPEELDPGEHWTLRIGWSLVSALIGTLVFIVVHDAFRRIKERATKKEVIAQPSEARGFDGVWVGESFDLTLDIPPGQLEPLLLTMDKQAYRLQIEKSDPIHGIAEGTMICRRNGHLVGRWTVEPATSNLNRLLLKLEFRNGKQMAEVIRRAE